MLSNQEISKILHEVAEYLEMEDDPFRPRAYEKAARVIELYGRSLANIYDKDGPRGLERIPGIGKEIAKKIEEMLTTGRLAYLERLKAASPVDVSSLTKIEGLGPKKIKYLWQNLGITNLKALEKALREKKVRELEGFGEKSEENLLRGIEMLKQQKERLFLKEVLPVAQEIKAIFEKHPGIKRVEIAGSIRRKKRTVGDIDMLILSDKPKEVINIFKGLPQLKEIYGIGKTKASGRLSVGIDIDVRIVGKESFGAALQYFTGNQLHNIQLRQIAKKKGYKLNEYGLFKGSQRIAGRSEEEIYKKLNVVMPRPEERKGEGEIRFVKRAIVREKSVGAVIYHKIKNQVEYLIVHYPRNRQAKSQGHWDYVKGHLDEGEDGLTALKREIKEETGLEEKDYQLIDGFKEIIHYNFRSVHGLHFKEVVLYLIEAKTKKIKLSSEHDNFAWLPYKEALETLTFKSGKKIIQLAHKFLTSHS